MIKENIYVAINQYDEIQWVQGSSKKTRYFRTDRYLKAWDFRCKATCHYNRHTGEWELDERIE